MLRKQTLFLEEFTLRLTSLLQMCFLKRFQLFTFVFIYFSSFFGKYVIFNEHTPSTFSQPNTSNQALKSLTSWTRLVNFRASFLRIFSFVGLEFGFTQNAPPTYSSLCKPPHTPHTAPHTLTAALLAFCQPVISIISPRPAGSGSKFSPAHDARTSTTTSVDQCLLTVSQLVFTHTPCCQRLPSDARNITRLCLCVCTKCPFGF